MRVSNLILRSIAKAMRLEGMRPSCRKAVHSIHGLCAQALRVDVDHEGREKDQAADQYFQEAVDVDVVEPVVEHAEHEQPDDGVADAAASAEQAGAADHDGGDRVQQIAVELVLL